MTEPTKAPRAPRRARKYARQAERSRKLAASLERAGKPDTAAMLRNLADLGEQRAAMLHPELYGPPAVAGDELDPADVDPACVEAAARVRAAFASPRAETPSPAAQAPPGCADEPQVEQAAGSAPEASQGDDSGAKALTVCARPRCGKALPAECRSDRLYCSPGCRVMACRKRKGTPAPFAKEPGR